MKDHYTTVFSNQHGIVARVCSGGVVSLSVGHTCLTLRTEDFLKLAQTVRTTETHLRERQDGGVEEQRH
jgi:hypothetical protein